MSIGASRRLFLQSLGALSLSGASGLGAAVNPAGRIIYVRGHNSIDVRQQNAGGSVLLQRVESRRPSRFAMNADQTRLFVANNIDDYLGLPAGSVESYAVAPDSGRLTFISRQSLSLSATEPQHLALSPDGRWLAVAAYGGGLYNVLPVDGEGRIGVVSQVLKEIGSGLHPEAQASAHPHSVVFSPRGDLVVGTDTGSDRINVFHFSQGRLTRKCQVATPAGSGPAELSLQGWKLRVQFALVPSVAHYRLHPDSGELVSL